MLNQMLRFFLAIGLVGAQYSVPLFGVAADLSTIRQRGYLVVAVKDNWRPLGFRDSTGQLSGLEIEIAQRLAQELLGKPDAVRFQPVLNQNRLTAVIDGQVDLAIAGVTITDTRTRVVSFSRPYYVSGIALISRNPAFKNLSDVTAQRIAILQGSATIAQVRYLLPKAKLVAVNSYEAGRIALETNQADVFAGDLTVLTGWLQQYPNYNLLPALLSAESLAVVLPKGLQYDELRRSVDVLLNRWQQEGWLQQRAVYWGLPSGNLEVRPPRLK